MNSDLFQIIIPAYNEERIIGNTITELIRNNFKHITVIDDGSIDNTAIIAESLGVTVIRHTSNMGNGAAITTGFEWSIKKSKCKYIATMDADGQHAIDDVLKLCEKAAATNAHIILGVREFTKSKAPISRNIINKLASFYTFLICRKLFKDTQCGLRCYKKEILESLSLESKDFTIPSEIIIKAVKQNLIIEEVPVKAIYTKYSLSKGQKLRNSFKVAKALLTYL